MMAKRRNKQDDRAKFAALSPFELKDELIKAAGGAAVARPANATMLNAGRGNPNFLATIPRHGFWQLGLFAMREAERSFAYMPEGIGGFPKHEGIVERFELFLREEKDKPGIGFLRGAVSYVRDQLGLSAGDFLYEMCEGILGANYPVPDRMLTLSERIVGQYLRREMIGKHPFVGEFDVFAVEGGTRRDDLHLQHHAREPADPAGRHDRAGHADLHALHRDPQAQRLPAERRQPERLGREQLQYSNEELDKLRDPKVKAFFLVNPSNPPSVKISDESLRYIASIVEERPDLVLLTDDVYGTFADDFVSLFALAPKNTILVYSYSKYFGATGWRLGTIATHRDNVLDRLIGELPKAVIARAACALRVDHHRPRLAEVHRSPGSRQPHRGAQITRPASRRRSRCRWCCSRCSR